MKKTIIIVILILLHVQIAYAWICSECTVNNTDDNKYCVQCGHEKKQYYCAKCGIQFNNTDIFCGQCGSKNELYKKIYFKKIQKNDWIISTQNQLSFSQTKQLNSKMKVYGGVISVLRMINNVIGIGLSYQISRYEHESISYYSNSPQKSKFSSTNSKYGIYTMFFLEENQPVKVKPYISLGLYILDDNYSNYKPKEYTGGVGLIYFINNNIGIDSKLNYLKTKYSTSDINTIGANIGLLIKL